MTTKIETAIRFADEFKDSPRYKAILAVFAAVDALHELEPVSTVMTLMNRTSRDLNGIERDRLPDLVRHALTGTVAGRIASDGSQGLAE